MVPFHVWLQRLKKLRDNPGALSHFFKKRLYYNLIADKRIKHYKDIKYLNYDQTIDAILNEKKSIIRFGDGEFDMVCGVGVYFNDWYQQYDKKLKQRLEEVMSSTDERILLCFNHEFILKKRETFEDEGIGAEYLFWTTTKSIFHRYYNKNTVYGSGLCFNPKYNKNINFKEIGDYFSTKNIIIVTTNTDRFRDIRLGISTYFIEAPKSNAWQSYDEIKKEINELISRNKLNSDNLLFLVSMGSAAKVLVYDLVQEGFLAWDTGQFFDLAYKELKKLSSK